MDQPQLIVNDGTRSGEFHIHDVDCNSVCAPAVPPTIGPDFLEWICAQQSAVVGIYRITNPDGGIYIGKSKHVYNRWKRYIALTCTGQPFLCASLVKYGIQNHSFELIRKCSYKWYGLWEKFFIRKHKSSYKLGGLNAAAGGSRPSFVSMPIEEKIKALLIIREICPLWDRIFIDRKIKYFKAKLTPNRCRQCDIKVQPLKRYCESCRVKISEEKRLLNSLSKSKHKQCKICKIEFNANNLPVRKSICKECLTL